MVKWPKLTQHSKIFHSLETKVYNMRKFHFAAEYEFLNQTGALEQERYF